MEARNERRLRTLQKHLNTVRLLIVDELGHDPANMLITAALHAGEPLPLGARFPRCAQQPDLTSQKNRLSAAQRHLT